MLDPENHEDQFMFGNLKYHVGAGSFLVSAKEQRTLQAFLGTCVGVAMYDDKKGVGGLFHILLPEPVCSGDVPMPEKYAATGLPLFLDALYKGGAIKENLKAVIAGGALVGPVDEMDLSLDIGGRSVDIVRQQLSQEGIPVERSETGGFFSCCLNLDLHSGEIDIEPAGSEHYASDQKVEIPGKEEIFQAMDRLKPIPQVALKILRLVSQDDYDISDISEEVRKDQVISAKTLQLSNSAMFSIRRKIETLDHALLLIGRDQLVKLVISAAVRKLFEPDTHGYSLCKGGLYHHALGTAIISETLAQVTGKVLPGLAYTAGLLHDIGKVVLDQYVAAAFPLFYRNVAQEGQSFLEAEKSILGIDHTQVGFDLAVKWGFPETLAAAIRHHHHPENETEHRSLTHILCIANLLMEKFYAGLELEQTAAEKLPDRLAELGLSMESLPDLVDALPEGFFSASPDSSEQEDTTT
jgi:putative nucleotidyltransferase with HDIG domain